MGIEQFSYLTNVLSLIVTLGAWAVFMFPLVQRSRMKTVGNRSREPLSWLGLALQLVSYPISWFVWRSPVFSPFAGDYIVNTVLQLAAIVLAVTSAWMAVAAIKELGKQWSLQARVLEDHKLVTSGAYGVVRHPIYTAMLGMLLASGLVVSQWLPLATAMIVFVSGTLIRIRLEEGLLARAFGKQFDEWKRRVPALIPGLKN